MEPTKKAFFKFAPGIVNNVKTAITAGEMKITQGVTHTEKPLSIVRETLFKREKSSFSISRLEKPKELSFASRNPRNTFLQWEIRETRVMTLSHN